MYLIHNIIDNYQWVQRDFVGISFHLSGFLLFFLNIFIAMTIFIVYFLFGDKLRRIFFKETKQYLWFINIAFGYIAISTGIGILGFFSLFQTHILYSYLILVVVIAFYQFKNSNKNIFLRFWKNVKRELNKKNKYILIGVFIFFFISFLRLSIPEIEEDTYHIDLPRLYLSNQTTIIESRDSLHVVPFPQLAEMTYVIPLLFGQKDAARFIHFTFYLLIILLLFTISKKKEYSYMKFAPLLLVTAPVVIRYAHSQYIDYFMVFNFLLSVILLEKNGSKKNIILSGIIFGGAIATKIWILVYAPAILIYILFLHRNIKIQHSIKLGIFFVFSCLMISLIWYTRAYIITGNPIYPLFAKAINFETNSILTGSPKMSYFGFNWKMFTYQNMIVFSPLFFLGVVFSLIKIKSVIKKIYSSTLFMFFIAFSIEQLFIKIDLGRYLLAWYSFTILVISAGISLTVNKIQILKYFFLATYFIILFYYIINTILILPYGFAWADQNKYLSRIMERNNASYYDFEHKFDKWINDKDLVAIYGLVYYYYADFSYIDARYVFSRDNRSFTSLKDKHVTKILVKDGDIISFCKKLFLPDCKPEKAELLVSYRPTNAKVYNLYSLRW